jgi:superfamily II DNA/RNA helicase
MAAGVADHVTVVPARGKFQALRRLIETQEVGKALIFCNRKREVASLRRQLERVGLNVRDIHGDLDQPQRTQALDAFKRGDIDFLVATDVAARGLDIVSLPCVINYDVPTHADDYVHRIGRTGRAGQEGRAFTLVLPEERRYVDAIAKLTGKEISRLEIPGAEAVSSDEPAPSRRASSGNGARARAGARREAPSSEPPKGAPVERLQSPEPQPPEPQSTEPQSPRRQPQRPQPPRPQSSRSQSSRPQRPEGPVVGMGDHVPLFMRRPVPNADLLPQLNDD